MSLLAILDGKDTKRAAGKSQRNNSLRIRSRVSYCWGSMFLVQSLIQFSVVFWISAVIAECVMHSRAERHLAPAIRAGFGFFLSSSYFAATLLFLSVTQAWVLGLCLLALYFGGIRGFLPEPNIFPRLHRIFIGYLKTFGAFICIAVFFFLPLIISNTYGPFTEGGGDISIYADTAKYIKDHDLTQLGTQTGAFPEAVADLRFALQTTRDRVTAPGVNKRLSNPPAAEVATYRVLKAAFNPFFSTPYVAFSFLATGTTYPLYYGIQALVYAFMLSGVWYFFRRFGRGIAILSVLILAGSHAAISVNYNMYSMQATCMAASALVLAALQSVRPLTWAGARTYGCILLTVWLSYIHYLSVLLPVLVCVQLFRGSNDFTFQPAERRHNVLAANTAAGIFVFLCVFVAWFGFADSITFIKELIVGIKADKVQYFGANVSVFSMQWISFLFGFLSQQHFQPFATEVPAVNYFIAVGAIAGALSLLLGAAIMVNVFRVSREGDMRLYGITYVATLLTVAIQLYLARAYLYEQAKGAQNVLVFLYTAMLLPLALAAGARPDQPWVRALGRTLVASLIIFVGSLFLTKGVYTTKLAFSNDRASILEPSYFSEATRIRRSDADPLVLFEPRKSADLYISIQPFFGARLIQVRDLSLQRGHLQGTRWVGQSVIGSDFIARKDLQHLWTLRADCTMKWPALQARQCVWMADNVARSASARLLFFGDDYQRDYGPRPVSAKRSSMPVFSYLRNGSALLFLKTGAATVDAILQPRDEREFTAMRNEIAARLRRHEFGRDVALASDGRSLILHYRFIRVPHPFLQQIARYSGEFWLAARLDGKDLP